MTGSAAKSRLAGFAGGPYALLTLTMMCWASNMVVARAGVADHIPPVALAQMRWSLAAALLLPFTLHLIVRDWAVIRRALPVMVLLSGVGIGLYNTLVYVGLVSTTAINATILTSIFPVVVAAAGFLLYRDRLTAAQSLGIGVTCIGALVIVTRGDLTALTALRFNPGDLWVLSAHAAYALYTVLLRERPAIHPLAFLAVTVVIGQALLFPFTLAELTLSDRRVVLDRATLLTVAWVALVPGILAYIAFNKAVAAIGSNRTAPFFHLVPIFGSVGAIAFLGEAIAPFHLIGWTLILVGIVATQMGRAPP